MTVEGESTVIALACGLVTELASVVAFTRYFDRKVDEPGVGELHLLGLLSLHFD